MNHYAMEVEDLTKRFGDVVALDGVTFEVATGEIFGFLGPNGAGKTTTINALIGLTQPTSGHLRVLGFDYPADIPNAQARIGVVPDESNLYPELSGLENLRFSAALYGMPAAERDSRALSLLERFSLADVKHRRFGAYSKGMKRKLTIAAALIHQPEILFLDEPTTGIDVGSARQIRALLGALNADGVTIFLTTHYIEEAERLCNRIAFLVAGKIVRIDDTERLLTEAQEGSSVTLALDGHADAAARIIAEAFPHLLISRGNHRTLTVSASGTIRLTPLLRALDEAGIEIFEARVVRSSLEDVFVRITGIEAREMRAANGGNAQ